MAAFTLVVRLKSVRRLANRSPFLSRKIGDRQSISSCLQVCVVLDWLMHVGKVCLYLQCLCVRACVRVLGVFCVVRLNRVLLSFFFCVCFLPLLGLLFSTQWSSGFHLT